MQRGSIHRESRQNQSKKAIIRMLSELGVKTRLRYEKYTDRKVEQTYF